MDEVETQLLDLAHEATLAVGKQMEAELNAEYGALSDHVEARVRKLNRQGPDSVQVRAWITIPKTVSRDDAIATGMRLSSSTKTRITAVKGKALKFTGNDGETVYRKSVRRPTRLPTEPFNRIIDSWEERITAYVRSNS